MTATPIQFASGQSSATVSGAVHEPGSDSYSVRGRIGQLLSISITTTSVDASASAWDRFNARFDLSHQATDAAMEPITDPKIAPVPMNKLGASLTAWGSDFPVDGEVFIDVGPCHGGVGYSLTVSIVGDPI